MLDVCGDGGVCQGDLLGCEFAVQEDDEGVLAFEEGCERRDVGVVRDDLDVDLGGAEAVMGCDVFDCGLGFRRVSSKEGEMVFWVG